MWTFAKALTTPIFWLLMVSGTLSLFTLRMVTVHQTAHLVDQGNRDIDNVTTLKKAASGRLATPEQVAEAEDLLMEMANDLSERERIGR